MFYGSLALQEFYNGFEMSPDELNKLIESVNPEYNSNLLTEGKVFDKVTNAVRSVANYYSINFKEIINCGNDIITIIRTQGISKTSFENCSIRVNKLFLNIGNNLTFNKNVEEEINKKLFDSSKENIIAATNLTAYLFVSNTLIYHILVFFLGDLVGELISSTLVDPINEEHAKQVAIKGKFIKEFAVIFNIAEVTLYMKDFRNYYKLKDGKIYHDDMVFANMKVYKRFIFNYFLSRGVGVLVHLTTIIIQWLTNNKKVRELLGISEDDEASKAKLASIGRLIGYIIHIFHNFFCDVEGNPLSNFYNGIAYRGLSKRKPVRG